MSLQFYVLVFEGVMILVLLSWEIFWLRRVWNVLNGMWADVAKNSEALHLIGEAFKPREKVSDEQANRFRRRQPGEGTGNPT